ncbi:DUF1684 domain-containing protein [Robertkochia marina]|uniref:DUF1684 domain-containing protein n=1 Tax=Robertkochia marina TaxID=1227945 RepID=A0A4V3UY21_9FLAO|nr:DUF1684 domain-containing protein [Robertkochia marina]THD67346.1 DUF1684 domain-containing protein [Robertkochia marina]TRZ43070.1 DUF1684 domain-containing protein [Robertkochia marina]
MITRLLLIFLLFLISCKSDKRYHDAGEVKEQDRSEVVADFNETITTLREEKDAVFRNADRSPLPDEERANFEGLVYFSPDSTYRVAARLERAVLPKMIRMETTTNEVMIQQEYGELTFELHGKTHRLKVYRDLELQRDPQYENYLFLPFTDLTNGAETYGGGRYLDLTIPEADTLMLDFNKAYNPYCAYNSKYSCPLVPPENHLEAAIRSGEQRYP